MSQNNGDGLRIIGSGARLVKCAEMRDSHLVVQLMEGVPECAVGVNIYHDNTGKIEVEVVELTAAQREAAENSIWAPWD